MKDSEMAKNSPTELVDSSWQKVDMSKAFWRVVKSEPKVEVFCRKLPDCRTSTFTRWKER